MKATFKLLLCAGMLLIAAPSFAQKSDKELKKDLKARIDRESKKDAKQLAKEGWKVQPGKLSLERQIQEAKYAELDTNDNGEKRFFIGTHQASGGNYSAAKQIADSRARTELAQSVYSSVAQKIKEQVSSTDFGGKDFQVIDEYVSASQSLVSAQLQGVTPVLEIFREGKNGSYEVKVLVKMDADKALKQAKAGLMNGLKDKTDQLAKDLDKLLPY